METLQVALGRRSYPIYIGGGLLEQAEELLHPLGVGRWAIVCDDTVAALYGAPLARRTGWPLVTFPAGEGSKSLEEYDRLCRRLGLRNTMVLGMALPAIWRALRRPRCCVAWRWCRPPPPCWRRWIAP